MSPPLYSVVWSLLVCSLCRADWSHYHNRTARLSSMGHTYPSQCQPPSYPLSMIMHHMEERPPDCNGTYHVFMTGVSCLDSCGECHQVCHHSLAHNDYVTLPLVYPNTRHSNASEGWLWDTVRDGDGIFDDHVLLSSYLIWENWKSSWKF